MVVSAFDVRVGMIVADDDGELHQDEARALLPPASTLRATVAAELRSLRNGTVQLARWRANAPIELAELSERLVVCLYRTDAGYVLSDPTSTAQLTCPFGRASVWPPSRKWVNDCSLVSGKAIRARSGRSPGDGTRTVAKALQSPAPANTTASRLGALHAFEPESSALPRSRSCHPPLRQAAPASVTAGRRQPPCPCETERRCRPRQSSSCIITVTTGSR